MKLTISDLTKEAEEYKKKVKATYQEIEHKLERLEERYVTEELKQDLYVKYVAKYQQEKIGILKELKKLESKCSNHEEVIDIALEHAANFTKMWASGGWKCKLKMQYLLFPNGLMYNNRNDTVRTEKINEAFLWMACQQQKLSQIKSGIPILNIKYSALMDPERLAIADLSFPKVIIKNVLRSKTVLLSFRSISSKLGLAQNNKTRYRGFLIYCGLHRPIFKLSNTRIANFVKFKSLFVKCLI